MISPERMKEVRNEQLNYIRNEIELHKTCVARGDSVFFEIATERPYEFNIVMNDQMAVIIPTGN